MIDHRESGSGRVSRSWHILMKESIVSASDGDTQAAKGAQEMVSWSIEHPQHPGNEQLGGGTCPSSKRFLT